jgi:outer membrane protein
MRGVVIAASLVLVLSGALVTLTEAPAFAQATQAQTPPAQQPPPKQPPAQPPAQPAAPAPQPPAPFPQGAKIGFVNIQRVVAESTEGKASSAKVNALIQKKQTEGAEKAKQLQSNQQKLQQSGGILSDSARGQLEKEIEKEQVEAQRFQQDAQAEINELTQELQGEFIKKVTPILAQVATEKGLQVLFDEANSGVAWKDPGLDLTGDVIKKLDAGLPKPAKQ